MLASALSSPAAPSIWRLAVPAAKPIVAMNDGAVDRHLYCVHAVTGDGGGLDRFARHLGDLRLDGLQVPKREMTTHLAGTIETMARHHVALLEAFQPAGPINLIGWSAGAIVALEMAKQLAAQGRDVPLLVALDGAPCNTGGRLSPRDPRYLARLLANLPRWIRDDLASSDWSPSGIRARLAEKLAARRGDGALRTVGTLDGDTVEALIARPGWSSAQKAFVHAMYRAMAAYVPRPYAGRVLVFETRTQPLFHLRQVGAAWRAIASNVEIVPVPGNHSGLIGETTSAFLAEEMRRRLLTS